MTSENGDSKSGPVDPPRMLSTRVRWIAGVLGAVFAFLGVWVLLATTFDLPGLPQLGSTDSETSEEETAEDGASDGDSDKGEPNEAGTISAFAAGFVLLIMAIQGTPLVKFSKEGAEFASVQEKGQVITQMTEEQLEDDDINGAVAALRAAIVADPRISMISSVRAVRYKTEAMLAAKTMGLDPQYATSIPTADFDVASSSGQRVGVIVKPPRGKVTKQGVERTAAQFRSLVGDASGAAGMLIMTDNKPSSDVPQSVYESDPGPTTRVVVWRSSADNDSLREAVNRVSAQPSNGSL